MPNVVYMEGMAPGGVLTLVYPTPVNPVNLLSPQYPFSPVRACNMHMHTSTANTIR